MTKLEANIGEIVFGGLLGTDPVTTTERGVQMQGSSAKL